MRALVFASFFGSILCLRDQVSCADYPECNGAFLEQNPNLYCGIRISNDTRTGPKCIYMLKNRDKEPASRMACAALQYKKDDNSETIKTGSLVTLNNAVENNMTTDYIISIGSPDGSSTVYFAYAFIGLRKNCRHCSFAWADNEPVTYTNWYGTEPNTYYYECTHLRATSTYAYQWIDMSCSSSYPAICQFFPDGKTPIPPKPILPQKGGCKQGWWKYGGYCYKDFGFSSDFNNEGHKTYQQGNASCWQGTDGTDWPQSRMAILPTLQHNNLVASLLGPGRYQQDIWIGVYNHAYYDYYFSLDNFDKLTYDNWAPGYPNHLHGNIDKCTKMAWKSKTNFQGTATLGQWTNQQCANNRHPWVCSHEQDPSLANAYNYPNTYALDSVKCEKGWIPYHTACYKFYSEPKSFDDANDQCQKDIQRGAKIATLATAWDEYESLFLESFLYDDQLPSGTPDDLPNGYWIGLKHDEQRKGSKQWGWVDRWPLAYSRWSGNEPVGQNQDCGFVKQEGLWGTDTCSFARPFVCKSEFYDFVPDYKEIDEKIGPVLPCDDGWVLHGHHCVQVNLDKLSFFDAEDSCLQKGGHLVSIHGENYNQFITGLFNSVSTKGGYQDWEGFWVGGSYNGKAWDWTDGTIVTYFNWNPGEPNDFTGNNEDCIEVWTSGKWNDDNCETKELPYICKKVAKTEWCEAALTSGSQKRCGESNINENECREFGCCWDPTVDTGNDSHCFKPSAPINVGMAAGAAVAVTLVVVGIAAGGYFYYTKYGFGAVTSSFANPTVAPQA